MNLRNLIAELEGITFHYHKMDTVKNDKIVLKALSLDPRGIDEAMKIKEIADRYKFHTLWDGQDIEILRHPSELH